MHAQLVTLHELHRHEKVAEMDQERWLSWSRETAWRVPAINHKQTKAERKGRQSAKSSSGTFDTCGARVEHRIYDSWGLSGAVHLYILTLVARSNTGRSSQYICA